MKTFFLRNQNLIAIVLVVVGIALPITTGLLTHPQNSNSSAATTDIATMDTSTPSPFPTGALGLKWLTFESEEFNFTHSYSKCMRPYDYTPPYKGVAGWVYRCEDGKPKMEVVTTEMDLSKARQTYPSAGELEFKKYQNAFYSGWKGEIPGQIVYYILERPGEKNIWVVGNLDQFDPTETPNYQPEELIAEVVRTLRPLK